MNLLRLVTFQCPDAWETLRREGALRADPRRVPPEWRSAYHWMMRRMRERLPGYQGGWPLWAWLVREGGPQPEAPEGPCVRLELRVASERALLSDFDGWHAVLNRWYLSLSEEEDEAWEARLPYPPLWPKMPLRFRKEVVRSWERMFDLELMAGSWWASGDQRVQAVLEEIRLADVVDARLCG